jgi:hypothetical protein
MDGSYKESQERRPPEVMKFGNEDCFGFLFYFWRPIVIATRKLLLRPGEQYMDRTADRNEPIINRRKPPCSMRSWCGGGECGLGSCGSCRRRPNVGLLLRVRANKPQSDHGPALSHPAAMLLPPESYHHCSYGPILRWKRSCRSTRRQLRSAIRSTRSIR